jgi:ribonuclease P protein component
VPTFTFPRRLRLTHEREFDAVYAAKMRKARGPLTLHACVNEKGHHRLGLSVGKSVGNAVVRNRVKRLLREAFRLQQHSLPLLELEDGARGLDVIIGVRRHDVTDLADYERHLIEGVTLLAQEWARRLRRGGGHAGGTP